MIEWPPQVVDDIARRRAVLFLGSGVSKNAQGNNGARPPTWDEFLRNAVDELGGRNNNIRKLLNSGDYLTACQIIKKRLDERWYDLLREHFSTPRYQPKQIHRDLYDLDSNLVITPNFDKIYDTLAQNLSDGTVMIKTYNDHDIARIARGGSDLRTILKSHGSIDTPDKMIFTREDYAKARIEHAAFYAVLDALLLTHTFIFIGCGMTDPDLMLILERFAYTHTPLSPHYVVTSSRNDQELLEAWRKNYNVKPIIYSPKNHHKELAEGINQLVERVTEKRAMMGDSRLW